MLTADGLERHDRQIMIRGLGEKGQEKLKRAKVIIAGSGEPDSYCKHCGHLIQRERKNEY